MRISKRPAFASLGYKTRPIKMRFNAVINQKMREPASLWSRHRDWRVELYNRSHRNTYLRQGFLTIFLTSFLSSLVSSCRSFLGIDFLALAIFIPLD